MNAFKCPVLGFAGYSGVGKTSLLVKLLPALAERGLRVSVIKHSHHDFEMDVPGKDSYVLRKAGAQQMLIASSYREALITEHADNAEPQLVDLINKLDKALCDIVLVEGFRQLAFAKIELHRASIDKPLLYKNDDNIIAIASDASLEVNTLPLLDINDSDQVADFIMSWLSGSGRS